MSSSSIPKPSTRSSPYSHLQSSPIISKPKFIWRFPSSKFDSLPSCNSKRLSAFNIQPLSIDDELLQRQQVALLIYDLGVHLNVSFSCIYTGTVYMHRYFMLHSFQQCDNQLVAAACLFLACKVNETPRPLIDFIQILSQITNELHDSKEHFSLAFPLLTTTTNQLSNNIPISRDQQIIDYENILLSTLGFCLDVEQPYTIITKTADRLLIPKEVTQHAFEIATKSVFFTVFPLKYTTNLIACFALSLALTSFKINVPDNQNGSQWFHLINEEFTEKFLKEIVDEYLLIIMKDNSKNLQLRFEQIRQSSKVISQSVKLKSNNEQSNMVTSDQNNAQQLCSMMKVNSPKRSAIPFSSSGSAQKHHLDNGSIALPKEAQHHTPHKSSLSYSSCSDYSPITRVIDQSPASLAKQKPSLSPKHNQQQRNSHINNPPVHNASARPIPTVTSNAYHNPIAANHHSRLATYAYSQYPLLSPTQHAFHPSSMPMHIQAYHNPSTLNYAHASSCYPQQQTTLFHPSQQNSSSSMTKRYGEPPATPTKRFRYNMNGHQHY